MLAFSSGTWPFAQRGAFVLLEESLLAFETVQTVQADVRVGEDLGVNADVRLSYVRGGLSQVDINTAVPEGPYRGDIRVSFMVDDSDVYFQMNHSNMRTILSDMTAAFPILLELKSYALLRPLLLGEKWLHTDIPAENRAALEEVATDELYPQIGYEDIFILNDFESGFSTPQGDVVRMALGINTNGLVTYLEQLKDVDIELEIADLNGAIRAVREAQGWDGDILEIWIDADGHLARVVLSVPSSLVEDLPVELSEDDAWDNKKIASALFGNLVSDTARAQSEVLVEVLDVQLSRYNDDLEVIRPQRSELIELEELMEHLLQEWPIIFSAAFEYQGNQPVR